VCHTVGAEAPVRKNISPFVEFMQFHTLDAPCLLGHIVWSLTNTASGAKSRHGVYSLIYMASGAKSRLGLQFSAKKHQHRPKTLVLTDSLTSKQPVTTSNWPGPAARGNMSNCMLNQTQKRVKSRAGNGLQLGLCGFTYTQAQYDLLLQIFMHTITGQALNSACESSGTL